MNPRISVLLPCFNASSTIEATIKSLLNQTFKDYSCFIIDNCSIDNTVKLIEGLVAGDLRFSVVRNSVNFGWPDSFHKLPLLSDAPYSIFLAADDYLHPECLNRLYDALCADPRAVCAVPLTMRFRGNNTKFISDGTYSIEASSQFQRLFMYFGSVTDNSRFYGLYRTEVLIKSNILMDFFAADFVFTALTLCSGAHVEVSGGSCSPLLWRELPPSMKKYFQYSRRFWKSLFFLVFPFFGGMRFLWGKIPKWQYLCLMPSFLRVNLILSWFISRSTIASYGFLRGIKSRF